MSGSRAKTPRGSPRCVGASAHYPPPPASRQTFSLHAQAVELAMGARGEASPRAFSVLSRQGLHALAERHVATLTFAEERAVELALALCHPQHGSPRPARASCRGSHSKPVRVSPESARDRATGCLRAHLHLVDRRCRRLSSACSLARQGQTARGAPAHRGATVELAAWVTGTEARALASALARRPGIRGVSSQENCSRRQRTADRDTRQGRGSGLAGPRPHRRGS